MTRAEVHAAVLDAFVNTIRVTTTGRPPARQTPRMMVAAQ